MWPVLFWLWRMEIITVHGQDVQTFIDDQQGQIIITTVVVEGATGQHLSSKCQLALHSRSFRVKDSWCGRERVDSTSLLFYNVENSTNKEKPLKE